MYGKHINNQYVCLEVQMDKGNRVLTLGAKANHAMLVEATGKYILEFLALNEFVIPE